MDKQLYHFWKDTANKVYSLVAKSSKDAKKEINSWTNMEMRMDYFIEEFCPLLDIKE